MATTTASTAPKSSNTSKAPKSLTLSTATVRNQRTLIWLQNQDNTVNWSRWDGIVTSLSAYRYWSKHQAKIVGMVIIDVPASDTDGFLDQLYEVSKVIPMVLLSQKVMSLKSEQYWTENYDNLISLSTMADMYPFIGSPWSGSNQDAIALFALLCRYNRIIDCHVSKDRAKFMMEHVSFANQIQPNKTWVFTQFFRHKNNRRYKEIKECLTRNCASPYVDKIVLLNEKNYSNEWKYIPGAEKIQQVVIGKRLTYADFLHFVHDNVPDDIYVILCNADIYFGDSIKELYRIDMRNKMLALLRWDVDESENSRIFGPRSDSQDSWMFLSQSIKARKWDYAKFEFELGRPGCDNAFAGHILRNHFVISNPAVSFKTYHLHNTNIRNYDGKDTVRSDVYMNIVPSYIIDTKQEKEPEEPPVTINNDMVQFDVKSSSLSNEITFCTMLEQAGRYLWEPSTQNFYFEASLPIYSWKKACVTPNGLVYDLYHIYTGKHSDTLAHNYWASTTVDIFTPLQSRTKMLAIPFKNTAVFTNPDTYVLQYLSRCKRLLAQHPGFSFWLPKEFESHLSALQWNMEDCHPVAFDEMTAVWADEVAGYLPGPESLELGREDITGLRDMLPKWKARPTPHVCVVVMDEVLTESFIKEHIIRALCTKHGEWVIRYVHASDYGAYDMLFGASLCVFIGGENKAAQWSRLWALPKDCCVVEFQQELEIDGEFQHLAHVCELKPWILLLSKGDVEDVQGQIATQFEKWLKKNYGELVVA